MHPLYLVVLTEPERRRSARFRRRSFPSNDVKELNDGKEIYEALTQSSDPDALKVSRLFMLGKEIRISIVLVHVLKTDMNNVVCTQK